MSTFWDPKNTPGIKEPRDPSLSNFNAPEGFWVSCDGCHAVLQQALLEKNLNVCPECQHHFRIQARRRLDIICDQESFIELDKDLEAHDFLKFCDSKPYSQRLQVSIRKTGQNDAFVSGEGRLQGQLIQVGAFEFSFMVGSMGTVVGEKVTRLFERALETRSPAIIFHSSGGARMQEGILSLMQMAKTTAALSRLREQGVPYISVFTDPTTGGVAASFAMLGDYHVSEPKSLIGFAGPRVIAQTINEKLPEGFQTAEFLLEHGFIDAVVRRHDLKAHLEKIIRLFHSA